MTDLILSACTGSIISLLFCWVYCDYYGLRTTRVPGFRRTDMTRYEENIVMSSTIIGGILGFTLGLISNLVL